MTSNKLATSGCAAAVENGIDCVKRPLYAHGMLVAYIESSTNGPLVGAKLASRNHVANSEKTMVWFTVAGI